jgi:hypothetical protein
MPIRAKFRLISLKRHDREKAEAGTDFVGLRVRIV